MGVCMEVSRYRSRRTDHEGSNVVTPKLVPLATMGVLVGLLIVLAIIGSDQPRALARVSPEHFYAIRPASARLTSSAVITLTADGFTPPVLTIAEGTEVIWRNTTAQSHTLWGTKFYPIYLPFVVQTPNRAIASSPDQTV